MKVLHVGGVVLVWLILASNMVQAEERPRYSVGGDVIHGGSSGFSKAGLDTINLMAARNDPTNEAGEPAYYGDFQDVYGAPAWNGWTHYDITQPTSSHFNVSNHLQADPTNHAAWCGDIGIVACDSNDTAGGYGNNWNDIIEFRRAVPDPGASSVVTVTADLVHDSEPGYDYTFLSFLHGSQPVIDLEVWDGKGAVAVAGAVTYLPSEYVDGTDIVILFRFRSDGGWSDEDCSFPSAGGCRVDDINVHIVNGSFEEDHFEDFEHDGDPADFGIWEIGFPHGVGDFAKIWTGLKDLDPCRTNITPQVAFIDDGVVVPGTGGSECLTWCYGPGGYIVTTTGGLAGPLDHIHNAIESPVMSWPAAGNPGDSDYDGILLTFGAYVHEDLSADAPGIFYTWGIRSADTDNSAGNGFQILEDQGWMDRNFVYYGFPEYRRAGDEVSDLMNPGRDVVQVQLAVYELGWVWSWWYDDGYPAPYFDNVTVKVYPYAGPAMSARELELAQDNFPERGTIDYEDLGSHHVRVDMALNIALNAELRNDPGDSIVVAADPVRAGAALVRNPELHYILDRNPVFDPYRGGTAAEGTLTGVPALGVCGWDPDWKFDFPDTGFFFPGDVLHYYIEATDAIGGVGGSDPITAFLPADTTGFRTGFGDPLGYHSSFTVRALPSIRADGNGGYTQPEILFINDFAGGGGENKWYTAMNQLGLQVGRGYDAYFVNAPSSGVGNGIGGRAIALTLENYSVILYTSGDLGTGTIANGDFNTDPSDDVGTLMAWLDQGGKGMFLTGDGLASDLSLNGPATLVFLENYLGAMIVASDIRPLIGNQATPLVRIVPDNPVFSGFPETWVAYGGCYGINTFDGVNVTGSGRRLAEFLDPAGQGGQYSFSAATLNIIDTGPEPSRVISMPYDLMFVYTDPNGTPVLRGSRTNLLQDVLSYLMDVGWPGPPLSPVLPELVFAASNHPNPFNPSTTIMYSMPRAGHLKLCVYNVRGQLLKTLIDGVRPAGVGQSVVWDGTDNLGSSAASGIYFYEARAGENVRVGKMTLLK